MTHAERMARIEALIEAHRKDCSLVTLDRVDADYLLARVERLEAALREAKLEHHICDDSWYSCPKSGDCLLEFKDRECNCGAEQHNARITAALEGE